MQDGSLFERHKIESIVSFAEFCLARSFPEFPLEVFLEISNVCNLKCTMCTEFSQINPYRLKTLKDKNRGFINQEDIDNNIVPLLEHALFVNCSGFGEPTVHPRFAEIIEYICQYDVLIRFITNGQHLTPQLINTLVENSVYKIMVSCSGATSEHYEKVYLGGKFDVLLENLRLLKEAKERKGARYPIVEINSLGFKHHVATFDTFVELMGDYGANIIHLKKLQPYAHIPELYEHVSLMRPWVEGQIIEKAIAIGKDRGIVVGVDEYAQSTVSTETEYQDAIQQLEAQSVGAFAPFGKNDLSVLSREVRYRRDFSDQKHQYPFVEVTNSSEEAAKLLEISDNVHSKKFFCMEPFKTMYIKTGGDIKPCCFSSQSAFLGSVKRDPGRKVWQGVGFEAVRHGIVQEKYPSSMCSRCLKDRIGPTDHFVHSFGPRLHRLVC
jgi:MoaA/NifB/PqqE/SkfB family radical SAM enzyme